MSDQIRHSINSFKCRKTHQKLCVTNYKLDHLNQFNELFHLNMNALLLKQVTNHLIVSYCFISLNNTIKCFVNIYRIKLLWVWFGEIKASLVNEKAMLLMWPIDTCGFIMKRLRSRIYRIPIDKLRSDLLRIRMKAHLFICPLQTPEIIIDEFINGNHLSNWFHFLLIDTCDILIFLTNRRWYIEKKFCVNKKKSIIAKTFQHSQTTCKMK